MAVQRTAQAPGYTWVHTCGGHDVMLMYQSATYPATPWGLVLMLVSHAALDHQLNLTRPPPPPFPWPPPNPLAYPSGLLNLCLTQAGPSANLSRHRQIWQPKVFCTGPSSHMCINVADGQGVAGPWRPLLNQSYLPPPPPSPTSPTGLGWAIPPLAFLMQLLRATSYSTAW